MVMTDFRNMWQCAKEHEELEMFNQFMCVYRPPG